MIRGTFANIRLRNQLAPGTEGGFTRDFTTGEGDDAEVTTVYEASEHYLAAGTPLVVLAGKEYGSGSSRDWAAKGTALLGVKAVIAESYERIHRSNLIGMGVLPLQYPEGETAESLGLTGEETFSFTGVTGLNDGTTPRTVQGAAATRTDRREFDAVRPHRHPRRGQLLPQRRDHAVRPAQPAQGLSRTQPDYRAVRGTCVSGCRHVAAQGHDGRPRTAPRRARARPPAPAGAHRAEPAPQLGIPRTYDAALAHFDAVQRHEGAEEVRHAQRQHLLQSRCQRARRAVRSTRGRSRTPTSARVPGLEVRGPDRVPARPRGPGLQHRHDPHSRAPRC